MERPVGRDFARFAQSLVRQGPNDNAKNAFRIASIDAAFRSR
jgi:hypothetical protein